MNNIDDFFPSTYLKAADLNGRTRTLTIDKVLAEDVGGNGDPKDTKPVLYFIGDEKPIVLNRTNAGTISEALGKNPTTWHGKRIEAFPQKTPFQGQMVPCIRVRIPEFDDDVPELTAPATA